MARKINIFQGILSSSDGVQVGDLNIHDGVIYQMAEDGLKKLFDSESLKNEIIAGLPKTQEVPEPVVEKPVEKVPEKVVVQVKRKRG